MDTRVVFIDTLVARRMVTEKRVASWPCDDPTWRKKSNVGKERFTSPAIALYENKHWPEPGIGRWAVGSWEGRTAWPHNRVPFRLHISETTLMQRRILFIWNFLLRKINYFFINTLMRSFWLKWKDIWYHRISHKISLNKLIVVEHLIRWNFNTTQNATIAST